jgi:hypothetical protein
LEEAAAVAAPIRNECARITLVGKFKAVNIESRYVVNKVRVSGVKSGNIKSGCKVDVLNASRDCKYRCIAVIGHNGDDKAWTWMVTPFRNGSVFDARKCKYRMVPSSEGDSWTSLLARPTSGSKLDEGKVNSPHLMNAKKAISMTDLIIKLT